MDTLISNLNLLSLRSIDLLQLYSTSRHTRMLMNMYSINPIKHYYLKRIFREWNAYVKRTKRRSRTNSWDRTLHHDDELLKPYLPI